MRIDVVVERLDVSALEERARKVLLEYAKDLSELATDQMTARQWNWPGPTLRFKSLLMGGRPSKGGGVLLTENPRDIVDTGRLMESLRITQDGTSSVRVTWTAPYAMNVITGQYRPYVNPAGQLRQPGYGYPPSLLARNFIAEAQSRLPFQPYLAYKWQQLGG